MSFHDLREKDGAKLSKLVSEKPSLVRFHADYCGHCKAMEPEWDKVKDRLSNMDRLQVVDVENSAMKNVPEHLKQGVDGYPTIRAYSNKGKEIHSYSGPREADTIVPWFRSMVPQEGGKAKRLRRKTGKKASSKRSKKNGEKSKKSRRQTRRKLNKPRGKGRQVTIRKH